MDNSKNLIGAKIKEIRKKNSLTQEAFSEKIGIETPSLSNIENGKCYPSTQTILKIMKEFGIKPSDFFDFDYLKDERILENEIHDTLQKLSYEKKQIIYRIIKSFDI